METTVKKIAKAIEESRKENGFIIIEKIVKWKDEDGFPVYDLSKKRLINPCLMFYGTAWLLRADNTFQALDLEEYGKVWRLAGDDMADEESMVDYYREHLEDR